MSSDRDQGAFTEYHASMPWLALPFAQRELKSKLSSTFKVSGIPTLCVLDAASGALVTSKGREGVSSAPDSCPWPPLFPPSASIHEVLAKFPALVRADGSTVAPASLRGAPLALYFSASWCPPCQAFTPQLAAMYKSLKAAGTALEIVFVSGDRSKDKFDEYLSHHPWCALPYEHADFEAVKEHLEEKYECEGIPQLTLFDASGEVAHGNACGLVRRDPSGFPWPPKPWGPLGDAMEDINAFPFLLAFCDLVAPARAEPHEHPLSPHAPAPRHFCDLCGSKDVPMANCETCGYDECASCSAKVAAAGEGGAAGNAAAAKAVARVKGLLTAASAPYFTNGKPSAALRFAMAEADSASRSVRKFCGLEGDASNGAAAGVPRFAIIDVQRRRKALFPAGLVMPEAAALSEWAAAYVAGTAATMDIKAVVEGE